MCTYVPASPNPPLLPAFFFPNGKCRCVDLEFSSALAEDSVYAYIMIRVSAHLLVDPGLFPVLRYYKPSFLKRS